MILDSPALWLGGDDVLRDTTFFEEKGIKACLSVCQTVPPLDMHSLERKLHINVLDNPFAQLKPHFWSAVQFVHEARANGLNVYVHCAAGISRSPTLVIVYLMTHLGLSSEAAYRHTVACRPCTCPNDGFKVQISAYEKADRDAMLAQLHSMYDSKALLEADWKYVKNTSPAADVEKTQHKLFKALMKQKKAAGERFGLEWLRKRMEDEEAAAKAAKEAEKEAKLAEKELKVAQKLAEKAAKSEKRTSTTVTDST